MTEILEVSVPEYLVSTEPDHKAIGKVVDVEIKKHFLGQTVIVRGVSSTEHLGKTPDELVETIMQFGTDRYDPVRTGDRYDNIKNKQIGRAHV